MKIAIAAFAAALLFLAGVMTGIGRRDAAPAGLPVAIHVRRVEAFERKSGDRPTAQPSAQPTSAPSVDEIEHETEDLDDSGRGRGRGRGRGGDDDEVENESDDDRSGSDEGSG